LNYFASRATVHIHDAFFHSWALDSKTKMFVFLREEKQKAMGNASHYPSP